MKFAALKLQRTALLAAMLLTFAAAQLELKAAPQLSLQDSFSLWRKISTASKQKAPKILFVGNSFTYFNSLPGMLSVMIEKGTGIRPQISQVVKGSWTLQGHLEDKDVQRVLAKDGPWDLLVLQDKTGMPLKDPAGITKSAREFLKLTRSTSTKTALYETWSDKTAPALQELHSKAYHATAKALNVKVVPVGEAFWQLHAKYPDLELYAADEHHPNERGSYLGACMFYKFVTGKSPVGLPAEIIYKAPDGRTLTLAHLKPTEAKQLQVSANAAMASTLKQSK